MDKAIHHYFDLMRIYHKFPCARYAVLPKAVSLVGFYWIHKPLAGERRLGEDREKVELAQVVEKCDKTCAARKLAN